MIDFAVRKKFVKVTNMRPSRVQSSRILGGGWFRQIQGQNFNCYSRDVVFRQTTLLRDSWSMCFYCVGGRGEIAPRSQRAGEARRVPRYSVYCSRAGFFRSI